MRVDWRFWSTQLATIGIPNIAWKERQYERHIGMPKGRFSALPGFGIQTRRTGLDAYASHRFGWICSASSVRSLGATAFTPSTPAVFLPWLSCVTLRTARKRAALDFVNNFWSL